MAKTLAPSTAPTHTPGPWALSRSHHQHEFTHWSERPATEETDRLTIAAVLNVNDSDANASLMAAAPELLHALRYLMSVRQVTCLHTHRGPDEFCAKCIADAAIAHAEGRS